MPLVTVSGLPCAGKSTRALQLKKYISAHSPNTHYPIVIINEDDMLQTHKSVVYGCVEEEKRVRAALLSAVERHLTRDTIVICDAMNYIKGFRYQLYCIARNLNTQSCVMHVGASDEQVREWNNARISISSPSPSDNDNKNCYTPAHLDELIMRYEEPDSKNRWDAPLFTVLSAHDADFNNGDNPGDEGTTTTTTTTTAAEIFAFLTDGSMAKKPKFSTVVKPLTEATYLTDLDQITADILTVIQTTQRNTSSLSSSITAASPHSSLHLHLPSRLLSLPELRRLRRQYTQMNKMHTRIGSGKIADGFIMFLNSSFEKD